ncbi:MAG: flagellar export chaperone FliS [Proteobacteria bacterium]|nr:flagellar export chaperone FliS [Pseudomonadota bacterium]
MVHRSALRAYQQVQSESIAHGGGGAELVVLLFDGIVDSLSQASICMSEKQWLPSGRHIARAQTIIAGLRETLDFERGRPVSDDLLAFYNAISAQLVQIQIQRDTVGLARVTGHLRELRSAWATLVAGPVAPLPMSARVPVELRP